MSTALRQLKHHDREDARQDAWVAALEKGQGDNLAYRRGCERYCAIEIMRQNDRQAHLAQAFAASNLHAKRVGTRSSEALGSGRNLVLVEYVDHLIPSRRFEREVTTLHGEDYRSHLRAQDRARYAARRTAA